MFRIKKILYPTDFSRCAEQALTRALFLAEKYEAELHILHVLFTFDKHVDTSVRPFPNIEQTYAALKNNVDMKMRTLLEAHNGKDLKIKKVQLRDIVPARMILNYADAKNIDLIVMGTHGHRGLGHLFFGSVTEEVLRLARCPILTIREQKQPKPIHVLERVLVPVDFSKHARTALAYAKEMAATDDAQLQLLHVIEEAIYPAFYSTGKTSIFELITDLERKSCQALEDFFNETTGPAVEAEFQVIEGRASRDIVKFAEGHGSDMIVIATHGLTGIEHFLFGSVAEKVIRMASCPVLTVKAFGKSLIKGV